MVVRAGAVVVAAAAVVLAFARGAGAADLELQPKEPKSAPSPARAVPHTEPSEPSGDKRLDGLTVPRDAASPAESESWWQQVVREAPGCLVFSDGCRTCTKADAGFTCSNLPIACQPKDWACSKQKP